MTTKKNTRRRGAALETAVLTAVWQKVNEVGYQALTIQDIANLAGTNKNTLYRHWPTKAVMVISAFGKFGPKIDFQIPNTGDLQHDLTEIFDYFETMLGMLTSGKLEGLLPDRLHDVSLDRISTTVGADDEAGQIAQIMQTVLGHAAERGEVAAQIDRRLVLLPMTLLFAEVLTQGTISREAGKRLVDDILMPVYRHTLAG